MIKKIFPYKLQLQILQLDEYNLSKFLKWITKHYFIRAIEDKKKLKWTQKAKAIYYLSIILALTVTVLLYFAFSLLGFIFGVILSTQAYLFLTIATIVVDPYEKYQRNKIKKATEQKLKTLDNLTIIGITGSYGKTSVKEFLYYILKTRHKTLKTPESYNTPLGIAKVVDLELDKTYQYFVCEMGAYRRGDIKEMCYIVHPKHGILTGINEQHLETFGSLENTTKGKFELIDSLPENGYGVVNIDNERISNKIKETRFKCKIVPYGFTDEKFSIKDIKQTEQGSSFLLILEGKAYKAKTKLLGIPNLQNILAASTMSFLLGVNPSEIVNAIDMLPSVAHRLEIKEHSDMTVIDDAYNSNVNGFKEAVNLLKTFKNRTTVFVTPGIVDLGTSTFNIHKELGQQIDEKINYVFLIGKSDRTAGLIAGIENRKSVYKLNSIQDVWGKIKELNLANPVVLLENDLPDNY